MEMRTLGEMQTKSFCSHCHLTSLNVRSLILNFPTDQKGMLLTVLSLKKAQNIHQMFTLLQVEKWASFVGSYAEPSRNL